jgi:alpha-amylase
VKAFNDWKKQKPGKKLDDNDFFMVAEVYGYGAGNGRAFAYDDGKKVDFYANGFESMINFGFKADAKKALRLPLCQIRHGTARRHAGRTQRTQLPQLARRRQPVRPRTETTAGVGYQTALAQGGLRLYYGDETARPLVVKGAGVRTPTCVLS